MKDIILKLLISAVLLFQLHGIYAQNWAYVLNNVPSVYTLNSIYFPDSITGYAVGNNGTIVKSTDNGNNWFSQVSGTNHKLNAVSFLNDNVGYIVGDAGTVLKTMNGGSAWTSISFGTHDFYSISVLNADTFFISGNNGVYRTFDGGNNWTTANIITHHYYGSVYFKNNDTGFVCTYDTLYMTANSGNTWTSVFTGNISPDHFSFPASNIGYSAFSPAKTTNGGITWFQQPQNHFIDQFCSSFYTDINTGYELSWNTNSLPFPGFQNSVISKTTDGGNSWDTLLNIARLSYLNSVFFTSKTTGFIAGGNGYGQILRTTSGTQPPGFLVNGYFTYDDNVATPLDSVDVYLNLNGVLKDSVQTDMSGFYQFNNVQNGAYNITAKTNKPWLGVNSTDAVKVKRHFAGSEIFQSSLKLHAADVDLSYKINTTNAVKITRRFAAIDSTFARGDWIFEKPFGGDTLNVSTYLNDTVIVHGANVFQNFKGRNVGDVKNH